MSKVQNTIDGSIVRFRTLDGFLLPRVEIKKPSFNETEIISQIKAIRKSQVTKEKRIKLIRLKDYFWNKMQSFFLAELYSFDIMPPKFDLITICKVLELDYNLYKGKDLKDSEKESLRLRLTDSFYFYLEIVEIINNLIDFRMALYNNH